MGAQEMTWMGQGPLPRRLCEAEAGSRKAGPRVGVRHGERDSFPLPRQRVGKLYTCWDLQLHCAEGLMSAFHRVCRSQGGRNVGRDDGLDQAGRGGPTRTHTYLYSTRAAVPNSK